MPRVFQFLVVASTFTFFLFYGIARGGEMTSTDAAIEINLDSTIAERVKLADSVKTNLELLFARKASEIRQIDTLVFRWIISHNLRELNDLLFEHVDFQLSERNFPRGSRLATADLFPVARCLARIGDKSIVQKCQDNYSEEKILSSDQLRIRIWILANLVGSDSARILILNYTQTNKSDNAIALIGLLDEISDLEVLSIPYPAAVR